MRLLGDFTVRERGGKKYALANGEAAKRFSGMLELNELGAFIFEFLRRPTNEKEICRAIMSRYKASEEVVNADVNSFIAKLRTANLIVE